MNERKTKNYDPYKLTPEWVDGLQSLDPSSSAFVEKLVAERTETRQEIEQIGYSDPVEYMMCNYGEIPDSSVLCHGETETITVHETTFRMERRTAELVKEFCMSSNYDFHTFCKYLASGSIKFEKSFANVLKFNKFYELSSQYVPAKMFKFSKTEVNRPRYWICCTTDNLIIKKILVVQPDRTKPSYVHYALKASSSTSAFILKLGDKKYNITEVRRTKNAVVVAHSCIYLLKL